MARERPVRRDEERDATVTRKKTAAQLDREIAATLSGRKEVDSDEGIFYLIDSQEHPLSMELGT